MATKNKTMLLFVFVWGIIIAHAQSRLTPSSLVTYGGNGILANYYTKLDSLLLPSSYYKFAYIVIPSFRPEYSLIGTKDNTLILRKTEEQIWSCSEPHAVSIKEYQLHVSPAMIDSISNLFKSAVVTPSYLSEIEGLDGTTYIFISGHYTAECWEPVKNTNCGMLVALSDAICKAVEQNDSTLIENNLNSIIELHHTFKNLYNEKPSKEGFW